MFVVLHIEHIYTPLQCNLIQYVNQWLYASTPGHPTSNKNHGCWTLSPGAIPRCWFLRQSFGQVKLVKPAAFIQYLRQDPAPKGWCKWLPSRKINISHLGKRKIIFKYAISGGYVNSLEGSIFFNEQLLYKSFMHQESSRKSSCDLQVIC